MSLEVHHQRQHQRRGFTTPEMLVALLIAGVAIGAAAVAYGTIARLAPRASNLSNVNLGSTAGFALWGNATATRTVPTAPAYGTMAQAEALRERFLSEVTASPAVYVLGRSGVSATPYRPALIPYDPSGTDTADAIPLDSSINFRDYIVNKGLVPAGDFPSPLASPTRFFYPASLASSLTQPDWLGCSIFVTQFSPYRNQIAVGAIYEVDIIKHSNPNGFYATVRRFSGRILTTTEAPTFSYTYSVELTNSYEVFYPAYNGSGDDGSAATWPTTTDNFAPLSVAFERYSRKSMLEAADKERFKMARERPFTLVWWPDPCSRDLGLHGVTNTGRLPSDARRVYNHMGGRTAYMFVVPLFPVL